MTADPRPNGTPGTDSQQSILVVSASGKHLQRIQRELRGAPYTVLMATDSQKALGLLVKQRVELVILRNPEGRRAPIARSAKPDIKVGEVSCPPSTPRHSSCDDPFQELTRAAGQAGIPVLLIHSLWDVATLVRDLEGGADYILSAPYQPAELHRAIRDALLNGPVREPRQVLPGVELIHEDRRYRVAAGREQLARMGFSMLEQLRQCRAALAWSQAESQQLRRHLRRERQQSQRLLRSPAVVQGIAHDFSNLLETVSAASTVLRSGPPQPKPYREALDAALAQAGVLLASLQNWTDHEGAPEETSDEDAVELSFVAREVLDAALLALRAPHIRVRLQLDGLPAVAASRPLMMRILSNLVWNAVEAMPGGGRLSLLGYQQRNRVILEVSDTGVGISRQQQEKIFRSQYSTKQGHAGMGLLLVYRLVQHAGGNISFVSNPGRGSTFALSFPAASRVSAAAESPLREVRRTASRE
jgi:signal transduction histidine kinase